jgi:hypothetical protein
MTGVIFLDLKKAFDTVDHALLLQKLHSYGIHDSALMWFRAYLTDRSQVVQLNSSTSDSMNISCGVPQGSILGPLFFTLYINDLPAASRKAQVIMYADDTAIVYSSASVPDIENVLSGELARVKAWLDLNKLTLNTTKTKTMLFGSPQKLKQVQHLELRVADDLIEQVSEFKYLGIWLDSKVKFSTHISKVAAKISSKLGLLSRIRHFLPMKQRKMMFNALVLPHFDYAASVWCNTSQKHLNTLILLHKRAGRLLLEVPRDTPTEWVYANLGWKTPHFRWKKQVVTLVFKTMNGGAPAYLSDTFKLSRNQHFHNTRHASNGNICIPKVKTEYGKRTFHFSGATLWNSLPPETRSASSLAVFKRKMKDLDFIC